MAQDKKTRINTFRLALCCVVASAVMAMMLYLHANKVQDILAKLAEKGKLENVEWLVEYASYFLPVAIVAIAITVVYSFVKNDTPFVIHREKTIVSIIVLLVTYAIMLPIVSSKKEPVGDSEKTLMDICVNWFAFQIAPLLVMIFYHSARAEATKKALDEPENNQEIVKADKKTEEKKEK